MGFAKAFDRCPSVVTIVRQVDGRFVEVNAGMLEQLGYTEAEVIGQRPADIGLWPDADTRARIYAALRTRQRVVGMPLQVRHKDGRLLSGLLDVECFEADGDAFNLCLLRLGQESHAARTDPEIEQESYRALFLSASEGLYRSLPDGDFIDVNPAMAQIFGYESATEMLARRSRVATDFYVDAQHGAELIGQLMTEGRLRGVRSLVRRKDGAERWILENARAVRGIDGKVRFFEGSMVDITEYVAAENALRHSEAMYRILVDNCRDGVFLIQHGILRFVNAALAGMLGYTPAELIGTEYMRLIASEDVSSQDQRRHEREAGSMALQSYEVHMLHRLGHRRLFAVYADAVMLAGEPASTGLVRDITDERAQQEAIIAAERRYRELFEQSPIGLFRTRRDGSIEDANPVMLQMLGYDSVDQLRETVGNVGQIYADPGEREEVIARILRDGQINGHETRLRGRDGGVRWVSISVRAQEEPDGTDGKGGPTLRFAGSAQDVQQRREVEAALQRSEGRYRMLVEHSQSGVFAARDGRLVYVNRRMSSMLGYSEDELVGMAILDLAAPEFRDAVEARARQFAAGEALPAEFEGCYLRKDGQRVYVTVSAGPLELDGETLLTGTVRDITRQHEAEQRLRFNASHDALTGLPNRMEFCDHLDQRITLAREQGAHDYAVLFVDLDGFKLVNDGMGHATGDRMLITLARMLDQAFHDDALVARYGGDEFTLLTLAPVSEANAAALAQRLLDLFRLPLEIEGHRVYSGASVGIVMGHEGYSNSEQVLRDADTAMYRAKAQGKAAYVFFDESMREAAKQRLVLETELRQAVERGEFRVHFQPVVHLRNGTILGCEALLRWQHPQRGLLLPDAFLEVAEESGLLPQIDWWVLREALAQLAIWRECDPALSVSVNIDERQFAHPELLDRVRQALADSGVPAPNLHLEITETVFRRGRGSAVERLESIKSLGVGLVVDDFGTGYSSLESFSAASFDALKLDHVFVADIVANARHRAIARTIVAFADELDLRLIAEGVETEAQRALLLELGCRKAQGYLFGKAVPPAEFGEILQQRRALVSSQV